MLQRMTIPLVAFAAILVAGMHGYASTMFTANITNDQENPPTHPTNTDGSPRVSFGTATFVLSDDQTSMTFSATVTGIDVTGSQSAETNDNLIAAHIHAGPNNPPTNNPVVWGFFGSPFNDNNPNDMTLTPFASGVGGTVTGKWDAAEGNNTTLADQLANIFAGRAYINFHTSQFGGGEIRGQIVPEPSSALLLLGLGSAALSRRRRAR